MTLAREHVLCCKTLMMQHTSNACRNSLRRHCVPSGLCEESCTCYNELGSL